MYKWSTKSKSPDVAYLRRAFAFLGEFWYCVYTTEYRLYQECGERFGSMTHQQPTRVQGASSKFRKEDTRRTLTCRVKSIFFILLLTICY